MPGFDDRVMAV